MSKREDIIDGKYWSNARYGLIYTKRLGWIDLGHAQGKDAKNLKNILNSEFGVKKLKDFYPAYSDIMKIQLYDIMKEHGEKYYFPVEYSQGMGIGRIDKLLGFKLRVGASNHMLIRAGLSENEKASIGLSILQTTSILFEALQGKVSIITDSGFSGEDLVSNLVGFYKGFMGNNVLGLAQPVSLKKALSIWDYYGPIGNFKNQNFVPLLFPEPAKPSEFYCRATSPVKGVLPNFLNKIQPLLLPNPQYLINLTLGTGLVKAYA